MMIASSNKKSKSATIVNIKTCVNDNNNNNNDSNKKRRHHIDGDESQTRKKRKLNENKVRMIEDRIHKLFEDKKLLTKESNHYKRERDRLEKEKTFYKKQMDHLEKEKNFYKEQYLKLKKSIMSFNTMDTLQNKNKYKNNNINDDHETEEDDIDLNINDTNYINQNGDDMVSKDSLNETANNMHNDINLSADNANIMNQNEIETEDVTIDYHQISPSPSLSSRNNYKTNNNRNDDNVDRNIYVLSLPSLKYTQFRDIRNASNQGTNTFDTNELNGGNNNNMSCNEKEIEYNQKRKQYYNSSNINGKTSISKSSNNKNKMHEDSEEDCNYDDDEEYTISVCCEYCGLHFDEYQEYIEHLNNEFDRDESKEWLECNECDTIKTCRNTDMFIAHLCGIHGHQYPFHCNMADISNGKRCKFSASTKGNLMQHLRGKKHQQKHQQKVSVINNKHEIYDENVPDLEELKEDDNVLSEEVDDDGYTYYEWSDCHFVSVNCKNCGKHWDVYDEYIKHLQNHFDNDPFKTWRECNEIGCDSTKIFVHSAAFLSHLHKNHQYENPFYCKMKQLSGNKCSFSSSTKSNMVTHLKRSMHKIKLMDNRKYKTKYKTKTKRKHNNK